jgi:hypothetical protein
METSEGLSIVKDIIEWLLWLKWLIWLACEANHINHIDHINHIIPPFFQSLHWPGTTTR